LDVGSIQLLSLREDHNNIFLMKILRNAILNKIQDRILFLLLVGLMLSFCNQKKELVDKPLYEGPISSMDSINTLLSDSGKIIMHMVAVRQNNFENGDKEWPDGLFLESFDKSGEVTSLFYANYVYFNSAENLYRAEGDVKVKSNESGDELNTEELFWNPTEEEFYTDKFVTINTDDEVHTGEGMRADQDFSSYRILKPKGTFTLEDDPSNPSPNTIPLIVPEDEND